MKEKIFCPGRIDMECDWPIFFRFAFMRNKLFGRFLAQICLLQLASTFTFGQEIKYPKLTRHQKDSLKQEIKAMAAEDQKYRWMVMFGEMDSAKLAGLRQMPEKDKWQRMKDVLANKTGISRIQKDSLNNLQQHIDTTNMRKIIAIINNNGFPTYIEPWEVTIFFLHLPELLDDGHINMLKELTKKGKVSAEEFALIYDRRQIGKHLPELYCVAPHLDTVTGKSAYSIPLNLDETNKARAEIGMKKYQPK